MFTKKFDFKLLQEECIEAFTLGDWSLAKNQILSLWTAYCLIYSLAPDTYSYDTKLRNIWQSILKQLPSQSMLTLIDELKTFDDFDGFMCQNLV